MIYMQSMDTNTRDRYLIQQLNNKFTNQHILIDKSIIANINDHNPQDFFPEESNTGRKKECYVLTPRRFIYGLACQPDRSAPGGYWNSTDQEDQEYANSREIIINGMNGVIGLKRSFCFYEGEVSHGHKTNWRMIEYMLLQHYCSIACNHRKERLDEWIICKVYYDSGPEALSLQMEMMDMN